MSIPLKRPIEAAVGSALAIATLGWTLDVTGLAKSVMGVTAPILKNDATFAIYRGVTSSAIIHSAGSFAEGRSKMAKAAIILATIVVLYKVAFWSAAQTRRQSGIKTPERFVYLSLVVDAALLYNKFH